MSQNPVVDDGSPFPRRDRGDFTVVVAEESGQTVAHVTGEIDIATCERVFQGQRS